MRLLQINSVYGYGSTGRIVKDIHKAALEKGIDSYVAYGRSQYNDKRLIKIGSKKDLFYHGLKTRFFDQHGLASKNATRRFIEQIRNLKPDIIHLHNIHGYYLNYPLFFDFLKSDEIKVYWTMHDCWAYTGHCSYYSFIECNKWETHCERCPQLNKYPKSLGLDNSYQNFEHKKKSFTGHKNLKIITPSHWLAGELSNSFLKEYSVSTIHNGIDLEVFKPRRSLFKERYGIQNKNIILGVASMWDERKGLHTFLELSKLLNEDEVIVLVGLKLKDYPNIISINRTNNLDELVDIYSSADALLNPTLEDNFPTVNLEAMACGVPVITFDSGGSKESIPIDQGQVINSSSSLNNVLESIRVLINKDTNKERLLSHVNDYFDKRLMIDNYVRLYGLSV